jgi:LysM repeat protein
MVGILVYGLLFLALILPVGGAIGLRLIQRQLSEEQITMLASLLFSIAFLSALVLSRSNVPSLQIGNLTLLLPLTNNANLDVPFVDDLWNFQGILPISETAALTETTSVISSPVTLATVETETTAELTPTTEFTPTTLAATPTASPLPTVPKPKARWYMVQEKDTLAGIAQKFGLSIQELLEANGKTKAAEIKLEPGQKILIPQKAPANPPALTPTKVSEPKAYQIRDGDTLGSIAKKFNVNVNDILKTNHLTKKEGDSLQVGQELLIP